MANGHDMGVKPGERVAIAMRNCPDWVLTFAAAVHVGAVPVLINSWGSAEELEFTLRDSDPTVLAADLPRSRLAADALRQRRTALLFSDVDGGIEHLADNSLSHLDVLPIRHAVAAGRGRDYATVQPAPEDMAMLLYTSGSTGHPKGVVYRHVSVGQALMHMMLAGFLPLEFSGPIELRGGATTEAGLVTVPLFHATGLFSGFLLPCAVGQKVVLLRKWHAVTAMQTIQTEKVTILATVPAILKDLLTHPRFDDYDLSSLSRVAAAGAATPARLPELLRDRLGIENRSAGYGMTETASVCATMSGPVFDVKPMAAGIISPIIDLRVVDAQGDALPSSQDGEIQLRGVTITPGYWQRDDLTQEAFTPDGWLRTGDLGNVDADGFLHITGRIKEIVIRGGENIAPIEIENVAYRHPSVKEVAVFGVPDDLMGEELAMVCHPQPDSTITEDELRAHLRNALPTFKVPKYVAMTDEPLPRNASEKIHRLALRNSFVAN
jgi:long-chain acyl-CoA synthetase